MLCNSNSFKKHRGNKFQTDYGELRKVRALLRHGKPVMALTATATHLMVNETTQMLGMHNCTVVKATSNRPNITYNVFS